MFEFLIGIVFAKTFLGDGTSAEDSKAEPKQSDPKTTPRRLTKAERELQAQERRRELREVGNTLILAVPLLFVVSSSIGGLVVTSIPCSQEVCLNKNLSANIQSFGKHHILAVRQPLQTMQLVDSRYYLPYWLGLLMTYLLLAWVAIYALLLLIDGMSYLGSCMWRVLVANTNPPQD